MVKKEGVSNVDAATVSDGYDSADMLSISNIDPKDEWILDSGCTYHMTPWRDYFLDYKESTGSKVLMGNNMTCDVAGFGSIRFKLSDGSFKVLTGVRHIPDLKRNLISVGMLDKSI